LQYGDKIFPNIDYLSSGYNIIFGDPRSSRGVDPGFGTNMLFDFSEYTLNGDKIYSVPKGVRILSKASCEYSYTSTVSTNT